MARVFDTPIITNDHSIERVLATGQPIIFIFLDDTPRPPLEQEMKRLARENAGKLLVVQAPVKDSPKARSRYQLSRFPALITIREGEVLTKAEAISETDLEKHAAYLAGTGPRPQTKPSTPDGSHTTRSANSATTYRRPHIANDATFEREVLHSPLPVLVDFWAPWCGPCRMAEPILEKLASEMAGRLRVIKVNVDENPVIAQQYRIQSIPTMMVVQNGQIADRWAGVLPEGVLRNRIAPFLKH